MHVQVVDNLRNIFNLELGLSGRMFVSPQNPYGEVLTPSVDVFGDSASKSVIKVE